MTNTPSLRYFNTGEVAIHYAEWPGEPRQTASDGDRPTYLFIHGITGRHETWLHVIDGIRQGARAVAVDLRGHGRSGHATGAYRLPDYARDVTALIETLKLAPVIVVGHSLGAMTAITLAATRPDLAAAVVLEDPPFFARHIMEEFQPQRHERFRDNAMLASSGLSLDQMAMQIRGAVPDASEEDIMKWASSLFMTDGDAIMHVYDQRIDWSEEVDPAMRSVQCPVLLMQGNFELGAWMLADDGYRANRLMPECELVVWEDTGHNLHSERPERFIEQVSVFVARRAAAVLR